MLEVHQETAKLFAVVPSCAILSYVSIKYSCAECYICAHPADAACICGLSAAGPEQICVDSNLNVAGAVHYTLVLSCVQQLFWLQNIDTSSDARCSHFILCWSVHKHFTLRHRPDVAQLTAVLEALQTLCSEGQIMVDLFVNYDCDMQAANLFERSVNGLSKLLQRSPPSSLFANQQAQKSRDVALDAVLSILKSLDQWAEPLKVCRALLCCINVKPHIFACQTWSAQVGCVVMPPTASLYMFPCMPLCC